MQQHLQNVYNGENFSIKQEADKKEKPIKIMLNLSNCILHFMNSLKKKLHKIASDSIKIVCGINNFILFKYLFVFYI